MAKTLADRLYASIKRTGGIPIQAGELMRQLSLPRARKTEVRRLLRDLENKGKVAKAGKDGYIAAGARTSVTGKLIGHADGYGFVVPEAPVEGTGLAPGEDLFIPRREMAGAMHGDIVSVRAVQGPDGRFSGSGLRIVSRGRTELVGRLEQSRHRWQVIPLEGKLNRPVMIKGSEAKKCRAGDLVQVHITGYPDRGEAMTGRIVRNLGDGTDAAMDSALVLADAGVTVAFPENVERQAELLPGAPQEHHVTNRADLRDLPTVTIDGENAKDFDDAVSLREEEEGVTLWVHIADVDQFAPAGSVLDEEAGERATSIYLPDMVVPMFPEKLSNGICSLRPEEERCTLTCEMRFDPSGKRTGYRIYKSLIKSHARLTYNEVNRMLVDGDAALQEKYSALFPMLEKMARLAEARMKIRTRRGSLDFDLPESMIELGEGGEIRDIVHEPREISHRLIEEFMLIANESVAEWLTGARWPCVYRVHETPDAQKIAAWVPMARNVLGKETHIPDFHEAPPPKALQQLLKKAEGHPAEHVLNALLVRSLKQARYTGEHIPHYGLAAHTYCHFTSPIRRYPDLMVHRLLKQKLARHKWSNLGWVKQLEGTAMHASTQERRAVQVERRVVAIKKCRYLADRIGQAYDGIISSVTRFGMFVELAGVQFDGLVPVENLPGRIVHDERHMALLGKGEARWQVGDTIRVRIAQADPLAGRVTLDLVEKDEKQNRPKPPRRKPPGKREKRR